MPGSEEDSQANIEPALSDDLVDDFLNDLDPPDEEPAVSTDDVPSAFGSTSPQGAEADTVSSFYEENAAQAAGTDDMDSSAAYAAPETSGDDSSTEPETDAMSSDKPRRRKGKKKAKPDKDERSLPWGMIAIVVLALLLLGTGGYGVVQQRSALQDEIRDLRAQLATRVTQEEADAERERQRQVELLNESLGAEVEALAAENADLANQLQTLETQLAEQAARAEAESKAASERIASAQREAQRAETQRASAPEPSAAAVAGGPWFVNFGSYAQQNVAERWANELQVDDGQVVIQTANAAGKTLYRVRVVGLDDQDQAERIATALERQYQLPRLWVGKN